MNTAYGLIGKKLGHSYSAPIHKALGNPDYSLVEIPPEGVDAFMREHNFKGINVTIPYKETVIPYLNEISDRAKKIGSVNTIVNRDGKLYGDNTDYYGFSYMAKSVGISFKDKKVMILGGGGTSLTAQAVTRDEGAREIVVISRKGENNYNNLYLHYDAEVIVNCTPVGMYPNIDDKLFDLEPFTKLQGVIDVIYNPSKTNILIDAKHRGIPYVNGLGMLVAQAKLAHELFFDTKVEDSEIERIKHELELEKLNIVFVGMPGSGKTTLSNIIAKELGRTVVDTDDMIVKKERRSIPEIFAAEGEEYFRRVESERVKEACRMEGKVIATGGGAILSYQNREEIMHNGLVIWLRSPIERLARDGRPLSSEDDGKMREMLEKRIPFYEAVSDVKIDVDKDPSVSAEAVMKAIYR
ncbi:MAG: AAA family ATPase [Clostridia bacterium]|nr:AAA family ATPase [Clostridia bacterium]